jgi:hypothetical protein
LKRSDKCHSTGISDYGKSSDPVPITQWTRQRSSNSSPDLDGAGKEGVAATSPPFVRAPAEDRSKYEKLIYNFEDISSDDSHVSQPEAGNNNNNVVSFGIAIVVIN